MNLVIPTGKSDRLAALKQGHGGGSFAPEVGVNVQQYFLLGNGRLLRARINILERIPLRSGVSGRAALLSAIRGRVMGSSVLVGTYRR